MAQTVVRLATEKDMDALVALENKSFLSDQFSRDQIEYLVTRAHATVFLLLLDGVAAGAAYLLWRRSLTLGRLYNISVDPAMQGHGLGRILLDECEREAVIRGRDRMTLEVRTDNAQAIRFYEKYGYRTATTISDYYEDGTAARKMIKHLTATVTRDIRIKMPYHAQSFDFSCGPACLMMVWKYFHPDAELDRIIELNLWRESTTVFMTSGIGGTGPYGLALAARRRGLYARILLSTEKTPFISSVRTSRKKDVIRLAHDDMKDKALDAAVAVAWYDFSFDDIASAMHRGRVVIVLISTYRLTGDRAPHWVLVTGFDEGNVFIHDPDLESYDGDRSRARNIRIPRHEFERMRRYGKESSKCAVILGAPETPPAIDFTGRDIFLI